MSNSMKFPIYSIGHGNRKVETFFAILKEHEIKYLIDVRTNPFSKFSPDFTRARLEEICKAYSVVYLFMGDSLGGKPTSRFCYDEQGHVVYERVMKMPSFISSAERLITAYGKNLKVACMCSELKPCECHRSKMIGEYLRGKGVDMEHIDEKGKLVSQNDVINQVTGGFAQNLFGEKFEFKSIGAY